MGACSGLAYNAAVLSSCSFRDRVALRAVALLIVAWLLAWPFFAEMSLAADDAGHMLNIVAQGSLSEALRAAWQGRLFRPLMTLSAFLVDIHGRTAPCVVMLQFAALLLALCALWRLSRGGLQHATRPWLVLSLWLLHPSVSVSLWQMDTLSQSASCAAGLGLVALACGAWTPSLRGFSWVLLVSLGVLTKETFFGWLLVALILEFESRRRLHAYVWLALGIAGAFLAIRLLVVGPSLTGAGDRYTLGFDLTVLKNLALLIMGGLSYGPVHALRLLGPSSPSWWAAVLGFVAHIGLLAAAIWRSPTLRSEVLRLWGLALLSLIPVLFVRQISELYLMGPNALIALALARSIQSLAPVRGVATRALTALLMLCAVEGLASRSYHFGLTWLYSRELSVQVRRDDAASPSGPGQASCREGFQGHSVYIVSPLRAFKSPGPLKLFPSETERLRNWQSKLDCTALPPRRAW